MNDLSTENEEAVCELTKRIRWVRMRSQVAMLKGQSYLYEELKETANHMDKMLGGIVAALRCPEDSQRQLEKALRVCRRKASL